MSNCRTVLGDVEEGRTGKVIEFHFANEIDKGAEWLSAGEWS